MDRVARRSFCGTALLGFPLLYLQARDTGDVSDEPDLVMDSISDEFCRITAEAAEKGFKAEHFRRYAGVMRTIDAHLEANGLNREFNRRLEDDDYVRLNPPLVARNVVRYWEKKGIYLNEDDITARLSMSPAEYREIKKNIKRQGGIRGMHRLAIKALEKIATEYESVALKGAAAIRNGRVTFTTKKNTPSAEFLNAQFPIDISPSALLGTNMDCFCKALIVESAILAVLCAAGILPVCAPAALLLIMEKIFESSHLCDPGRC